jgi:hypothetical protein
MSLADPGLYMDSRAMLSSVKIHVVLAHALGRQANVSGATQMIYHSENLIPRGIWTTIEKLFEQQTGVIRKHCKYSMSQSTLSSHISHHHAPFR